MTTTASDARPGGLLAWQWSRYPATHRDRRNLLTHALTAPFFVAGTVALVTSPFARSAGLAIGGLAATIGVMAIQGRTHKGERVGPAPFRGPLDVVQRFLAEQWFTFPRYLLSGEFTRAWRGDQARAP